MLLGMLPETLMNLTPLMPSLSMMTLSKATQIYSKNQEEQWSVSGFLEEMRRVFTLLHTNRIP